MSSLDPVKNFVTIRPHSVTPGNRGLHYLPFTPLEANFNIQFIDRIVTKFLDLYRDQASCASGGCGLSESDLQDYLMPGLDSIMTAILGGQQSANRYRAVKESCRLVGRELKCLLEGKACEDVGLPAHDGVNLVLSGVIKIAVRRRDEYGGLPATCFDRANF